MESNLMKKKKEKKIEEHIRERIQISHKSRKYYQK